MSITSAKRKNTDAEDVVRRYQAEFCLNNVASHSHSVFHIDRSSLRPHSEKNSHWSIAWSDLMMTMFILFLSLFVYQAAHKDFLISDKREIIGGETTPAMDVAKKSEASLPFAVIKPSAPFITAGEIPRVESITLQEINLEATFSNTDAERVFEELSKKIDQPASTITTALPPNGKIDQVDQAQSAADVQPPSTNIAVVPDTSIKTLFDQSERTIDLNNLNEFATIDLIPNTAVRIILTGDLLFETGQAELSKRAVASLQKIGEAIITSTHQIHIEGHTDNVPIYSDRYANNWELSMARANAVAAFLIEDMNMDPSQFVISGYASYKPVTTNSSAENRAKNRRVEIVVTKPSSPTTVAALQPSSSDIQPL